jgi:hypothetical protein
MLMEAEDGDSRELDDLLEEELRAGEENLDMMQFLSDRARVNRFTWIVIQFFFLGGLLFLVSSLTSASSRFISPVFEPFVVPVCILLCFLLYISHLEYQRLATEFQQLKFFTRRLGRAIDFARDAVGAGQGDIGTK